MKIIHTDSYDDTLRKKQRISASSSFTDVVVKIKKSPYRDFNVIVIDQDLYLDSIEYGLIDGLPLIWSLKDHSPKKTI